MSFNLIETTIADVHGAFKSGELTCRQLVQMYLDRIQAFDKNGPSINAIISVNPKNQNRIRRRITITTVISTS